MFRTSDSQPEGVVRALRAWVADEPERTAFTFLERGEPDGPRSVRTVTGLHTRALLIAERLRRVLAPGDRALLLFAPGLDFVDAFFGCLYAGVIAVPAYPPDPARLQRTVPRLVAIAESAGATAVLTQRFVLGLKGALPELPPVLADCPWIAVDDIVDGAPRADDFPAPDPDALAFLQYTSGSTGAPRGVMVSHRNLAANAVMSASAMDARPGSVVVSWLPLFHDMGLIGTVITAAIRRLTVYLMSPLDFLKRPLSWLRVISATGATHSGGPNFAYGLCARKATPEALAGLDLSRWRAAFNGAEPVDPAALDRFADAFAPIGFDRRAFFPTYGLAEATLFVSGGPAGKGPATRCWDAGLLEQGVADQAQDGQPLVSCGRSPADTVRIVAEGRALDDRRVGEIWVRGPHVAAGYWNDPAATAAVFGHTLPDSPGAWMRTGDLGFVDDGHLFVTGRVKDLIIVNGRNLHPHDIERVAEKAHPAARPGGYAAFGVPTADGEGVGLLVETALEGDEREALIAATRRAVSDALGVTVGRVVTLPRRTLPKTSSGKVQRRACRALYLDRLEAEAPAQPAPTTLVAGTGVFALLVDMLAEHVTDRDRLRPEATLAELGIDSVAVADLGARLEDRLGRYIDMQLLGAENLGAIAAGLERAPAAPTAAPTAAPIAADWRSRDVSHFQSGTGSDLFEIHEHYAQWSSAARPGGYDLYDQALTSGPAAEVRVDGSDDPLINLASYNYLGLSTRPEVAAGAAEALQRFGLSASGSPLLSGLLDVHDRFEEALARFKNVERVLLFPTGYATNVGVISALAGPGDTVIADSLAHASIVDGVSLARARMVYFRHNDLGRLERALRRAEGRTLVAVEGVYSMDGDLAPLPGIVDLCQKYGARLLVDEAHSAFVFGENGRGAVEHFGVEEHVDVHVGTLSKSMGGMGGYVGGTAKLIDYIKTYARARTFSCALAPPVVGGLLAALQVLEREPELRARLWRNVEAMREALVERRVDIGQTASQVIPVLVHDDEIIFDITKDLLARGVYLNPVRYPAVKKNHARFRISVSAAHTPAALTRAAHIIADVLEDHGVIR